MHGKSSITTAVKPKTGPIPAFRLAIYLGLLLVILMSGATAEARDDGARQPFRMTLSASMFRNVNEADLLATMKVWIMTVAEEKDLLVDPHITIQPNLAALAEFGRTHSVDGFALSTPELDVLGREFHFDRLAVGVLGEHIGDEYMLLVHRDGGIERLDQLKASTIYLYDHVRMSLARIWLDTVLLESNLGTTAQFFHSVSLEANIAKVVLPVFFETCMACLVTRTGFEVMTELNPQLKQQMRVLAVSPSLIAGAFAFRSDTESTFRPQFLNAIDRLDESQSGRQLLTLTQADTIEVHPFSVLDDSLALIAKHRRLCANNEETPSVATAAADPPSTGETK